MRERKLLCQAVMLILVLASPLQGRQFARWFTSMGTFTSDLRDEIVPITANNFISLTNSGFYDGLIFHRVVEGFVIQDGDPLGTGFGGPGYTIPDEFSPLLHHDSAGVLAMANTGLPNSAGSQYYITLVPRPQLDGNYAIFGKVFEGLDVVLAIGSVPVDDDDHPITNVYIDSLRMLDLAIYNVSPPADSVVHFDPDQPQQFVVEAFNITMTVQISWYVDEVLQQGANDILFQPSFTSPGPHNVKCVTATEEVSWTTQWEVEVEGTANSEEPAPLPTAAHVLSISPNPFRQKAKVGFYLTKAEPAEIRIYDIKGRLVTSKTLAGKSGLNSIDIFDTDESGEKLQPGLYLIKVNTASRKSAGKAVLLK